MCSFWRIVVAMVAISACAESESFACTCMQRDTPPCQAAWASDVVFAGTVLSIELVEDETASPYNLTLVTFRVDRAFISAPTGQAEIITNTSSSCAYRFKPGGSYLVYAWKTETSRLSTSRCSRTRPIEEADDDIRYLTSIGTAPPSGRVYGRVDEWQRDLTDEQTVDHGPVQGLTISVWGETFVRDAVTDAHGKFEITGLPVGKATVTSIAPFGFEPSFFEHEIEIRDPRACSEVSFSIRQAARASGTVVDASGQLVSGIWIDVVAAELAGLAPWPYQFPVKTDENGIFEFTELPPGAYVFGVNLTKVPGRPPEGEPLFLPGTRLAPQATVIELRAGDRTDVGVLRMVER
jgi:hypothetical protein